MKFTRTSYWLKVLWNSFRRIGLKHSKHNKISFPIEIISHCLLRYGSNVACWDYMSWTFLWFLITLVEVTYYAFHTFSFHGCANRPCRSMDHLSSPPSNLFRVGYGWRINDHQWKNLLTHLSVRMNSTSTFTSVRICNFFLSKLMICVHTLFNLRWHHTQDSATFQDPTRHIHLHGFGWDWIRIW